MNDKLYTTVLSLELIFATNPPGLGLEFRRVHLKYSPALDELLFRIHEHMESLICSAGTENNLWHLLTGNKAHDRR
jgi:hypothetical protein